MKRLPITRFLLASLVGSVALNTGTAQTSSDPNQGSRLTYDSTFDSYDLSWWGQTGRTYFIQQSDDLFSWEYLHLIESGEDDLLEWTFTSTADKFFLRLRYSDIPTSDPFNADFDGDKVSNDDELWLGTDPLVSVDSDSDGLPDDWEKKHFGNLASDADDDPDNDGLSNSGEFLHGSNPTLWDSDNDGVSDGDEVNIYGSNPVAWDTDGDGLNDGFEIAYGFDPTVVTPITDTDGDGLDLLGEQAAGTDPNNADTDGDGVSDGAEQTEGTSPTDPDSDGDGMPDKFEIHFKADTTYRGRYKYGFPTYLVTTPPERYLKKFDSWTNMSGGNPESGPIGVGPGTRTQQIDPLTGDTATQNTGVGGSYASTATSATTAHDAITLTSYDDPPNQLPDEPGTVTADATLSIEHTTPMLRLNTYNTLPSYLGVFIGYGSAYEDTSVDELDYSLQKMKYKFTFGGTITASLKWVEMFRPENKPETQEDESQDPTFTAKLWSSTASETNESEINPYEIDPTKDGTYEVVYVDSVHVDYPDIGSHKIPSSQYANNIRGKDHFVCVKDSGDVYLHAYLNTWIPDPAVNKITWTAAGTTIISPASGQNTGDKLTARLSTATAGKYPVTMSLDGNVLWEGVVWVVWCGLQAVTTGTSTILNKTLGITSARQVNFSGYRPRAGIQWNATIHPAEIITDTDRPAIEKQTRQAPPGGDEFKDSVPKLPNSTDDIKLDGTDSGFSGWDMTRRIRDRFLYGNPSRTPTVALQMTQAGDPVDLPWLTPTDFPSETALGNDDHQILDEDDNPYDLATGIGTLRAVDEPSLLRLDTDHFFGAVPFGTNGDTFGANGDALRAHQRFGEFVRMQLGQTWYRCSDFWVWRFDWSMKRLGAQWNAEAGQTDVFDLSDPDPLDF